MVLYMGATVSKSRCNYCESVPMTNRNPYLFDIRGLGKHDGRTICGRCLEDRLLSGIK